jgi:hypothetical protein
MPGMPGMSDAPAGSTLHSLTVLGLLSLFWTGTVLHLIRLIAGPLIAERDTPADVAHAIMGAAMAYMLFPGAWTGPNLAAAAGFVLGATAFLARALRPSRIGDPAARRTHAAVIAVSYAAMAVMVGTHTPSSRAVGGFAAALLVGCAAVHTRILRRRPQHDHRGRGLGLPPGQIRLLVTAPGVAVTATTLGMAYMVVAM